MMEEKNTNRRLKISISVMSVFVAFLIFSAVQVKITKGSDNYYDSVDSFEDVMVQYHEYVNDTFNAYTKKMLAAKPDDKNGVPPENKEQCLSNTNNFSTYCLSINLLESDKGYLKYRAALQAGRTSFFRSSQEEKAWSQYVALPPCIGLPCDKNQFQPIYQAQKALSISEQITAVDREITASKSALDKALAAYDQLRFAYPMHLQYMNIFNALVEYRDKLVEVRHQTDQYPARFKDVTTAKCT